jgi:hypothetical protein
LELFLSLGRNDFCSIVLELSDIKTSFQIKSFGIAVVIQGFVLPFVVEVLSAAGGV